MTLLATPRTRVSRELIAAMRWCLAHSSIPKDELADRLYVDWYARTKPGDAGEMLGAAAAEDADPVAAYRAAHAHDRVFEPGWRVLRVSNLGRLHVGRGDEQRVVERADVLPRERILLPPRPGDEIAVAARRDVLDDTGFWFTFLSGWRDDGPAEVVRFYWPIRRSGAPALVRSLTSRLPEGVPAALKVGAATHLLGRPDAAVLYVASPDAPALVPLLRRCADELRDNLTARTPPLALALTHGLATAQDPRNGQSFGQHRCAVLADAARTVEAPIEDDALLATARGALRAAGIDPLCPYRNAGSDIGEGW